MSLERLNLLRPYLDRYKRRFTVLDLGAGIDLPVAQLIAREYDCAVVAVEQDFAKFDLVAGLPRFIVLKAHLEADGLALLGQCEFFDVVLAFNFVHWFEERWRRALSTILGMATQAFVQLPAPEESTAPGFRYLPEMVQALEEWDARVIGAAPEHPGHPARPVWRRPNPVKQVLTRSNVEAHQDSAFTIIEATPSEVTANMRKGVKAWAPGINLWTFCKMGGVWPRKEKVLGLMRDFRLPPTTHGDVAPWNFVFDGDSLVLVDGFEGWMSDDEAALEEAARKVDKCLAST